MNDWGPFPKLFDQLSQAAPLAVPVSHGWSRVLNELGSPWDLYAQSPQLTRATFWPASLPPPEPPRPQASEANRWWARVLKRFWRHPRFFACRPSRLDKRALAHCMAECHTWLSYKVLQYVDSKFAPFLDDTPDGFCALSQKSLAWTLYAYALDRWGPRIALKRAFPSAYYDLQVDALPGDAIALHMHMEYFVQSLSATLRPNPRRGFEERHPGGLRTLVFIKNYSALPDGEYRARTWLTAINPMIAANPLTQLVYADLISGERATSAIIACLRSRKTWGNDFWLSQVARSLVGAMLSPVPAREDVIEAEQRLAEAEAEARIRSQRSFFFERTVENDPAVVRAREKLGATKAIARTQYLQRIQNLSGMFQANPYLHIRTLDMLMRHLVTISTPQIRKELRAAMTSGERVRAEQLLFERHKAFADSFEHLLVGQDFNEFQASLNNEEKQMLRGSLIRLFTPSIHIQTSELAEMAGVPTQFTEKLRGCFRSKIKLPFEPPDDEVSAPAAMVTRWLESLLSMLPKQTVTPTSGQAV
jgi:hypothetical protein